MSIWNPLIRDPRHVNVTELQKYMPIRETEPGSGKFYTQGDGWAVSELVRSPRGIGIVDSALADKAYYQTYPNYYPTQDPLRKSLNERGRRSFLMRRARNLALSAFLATTIITDKPITTTGVATKPRNPELIAKDTASTQREAMLGKTATQKFLVQYQYPIPEAGIVPETIGGSSIIGAITRHNKTVAVGSTCLRASSYDPWPNTLRGKAATFFNVIDYEIGKVPGSAALDLSPDGNELIVKPLVSDANPLHFAYSPSLAYLQPSDAATERILQAYNCPTYPEE